MEYNFSNDLKAVREILGMTQAELASVLGVQQITISRNEQEKTKASEKLMEQVYGLAFEKKIRLGKLKEMLWLESLDMTHRLLFHGAKDGLFGEIDVNRSRTSNDFGQGFYTGESYEQAVSFVYGYEKSSVYFMDFDSRDLRCKKYVVDQNWMLTIAYYRGLLDEYKDHPLIKKLVKDSGNCDYIIAPIADNRMFTIINTFIAGEITDEQCKHCLAATNPGNQYIFKSRVAANNLKLLERSYISENEREYYKKRSTEEKKLGDDKVKYARIQYRGKGRYIDELLQ